MPVPLSVTAASDESGRSTKSLGRTRYVTARHCLRLSSHFGRPRPSPPTSAHGISSSNSPSKDSNASSANELIASK